MKFFHSIQVKLTLLFLVITSAILVVGIYSSFTLRQMNDSAEDIFDHQTPTVRSIQQALIALENAGSSLNAGMAVISFDQLEEVRSHEAEFDHVSLEFSMHTNALIWGSSSDAFKNVDGGILYAEWVRDGHDKQLVVPKVEREQAQLIGQADIFFGSFSDKSAEAFSLKKKLLRLSTTDDSEKQTAQIKLDLILEEIKGTKQKLSGLMKEMITASDEIADRQILIQRQLMASLSMINMLFPVVAFVIAIVLGVVFSRLLFITPIKKLSQTADSIAKGDFSKRSDIVSQDEIGQLAHNFNLMTDTLVQRTLQVVKEQVKLQASIDSLNLGFIMTDIDNKMIKMNDAAKRILCSDSQGVPCDMPFIINKLSKTFDILPNLEKCKAQKTLIDVKDVPFGANILHIFLAPILEGQNVIGTVVLIEDVTEEKVLQRSKDEFFSIASHELRTPLTSIRGNSAMIRDIYGAKMQDKEMNEMVDDIHESSVRLIGIVNDFLNVSRLEQGKMEFKKEVFDIHPMLEEVIKELTVNAKEKNLTLTVDGSGASVFADKSKLREVVLNLIGNSIKFTDHGGVHITVAVDGPLVKVTVTDTGRGISEENQKLLFHKFQQAGSSLLTRDTTKGTGLGLYISKLMIEAMGGKIQLESSVEGQGTTFFFTIPQATEDQKQGIQTQKSQTVDITTGLATGQ